MNRVSQDQFAAEHLHDGAALILRAREFAPLIETAAPRIEADRALTEDVLAALHQAGLFRMLLPRSCGGAEINPVDFVQVIE